MESLDTGLREAIAAYEEGDKEGPFLVAQQVPWAVYDAWMDGLECHWRLQYKEGDVWMHGDPSIVHETVSQWFNTRIISQICTLPGVDECLDVITPAGASRLPTVTGDKEPDQCYFSNSDMARARAVVEVAYRNETIETLREVVETWEQSGYKLVIGVKVTSDCQFTFLAKEEGSRDMREIMFGPEFCKASEGFVIKFPMSHFTGDVRGDYHIEFDLFKLQQFIIKMMDQELSARMAGAV
ncbi:hypothetical protein SELMODRAFT_431346 [Selaginella moellendorffii]|uniref:Uncharacterized protein n=1 Tax=Selaginella moellendorffii TaxID=88036 RepID=D8TCA8_SELML|nr:hypothetical protein SELMODRAFT_431346 [Selaginella moellendorffii]